MFAVLASLLLGGCGLSDPYAAPEARATPGPAPGTDARPEPDRADPAPALTAAPKAGAGAARVAAAYALAQTNWSWRTFARQYDRMRTLAAGRLARELAAQRPDAGQLDGIAAGRQFNRSTLVAVDARRRPGGAHVVLVLRERAGGAGVTELAARHTVHEGRLARRGGGWKVLAWQLLAS